MEPRNACCHSVKLIDNDLKDKWILDNGSTNLMTGNPEHLDGIMPRIVNLRVSWQQGEIHGHWNRLIQVSYDLIPSLEVPGLKVDFISCGQLGADRNWRFHLRQRKKQAVLTPNS